MSKVMNEFIKEKAKQLYTEVGIQYREILDKINIEDFIRRLLEEAQGMGEDWLPTPENINALPEPVREYIHDIETNIDPQGMVRDNVLLRDTCKALEIKLEEKVQVHDELLIKYTEKFREDYERGFCSRNSYKGRLKQFAQEAGLEMVKK